MIGAIVRHWVGISLARCNNFSSSSLLHSVFLILGSSHSNHRALHCFADLRCNNDAILDHWFFPYFITAALRISSCKELLHLNRNQINTICISEGKKNQVKATHIQTDMLSYLGIPPNTTFNHNSRHFDDYFILLPQ